MFRLLMALLRINNWIRTSLFLKSGSGTFVPTLFLSRPPGIVDSQSIQTIKQHRDLKTEKLIKNSGHIFFLNPIYLHLQLSDNLKISLIFSKKNVNVGKNR